MNIKSYTVITEFTKHAFQQKINELISQGYQPFGSPSVVFMQIGVNIPQSTFCYSQGMAKY